MAAVTRLGLYGGPRSPYGSFAGKTAQEIIAVEESFSGGFAYPLDRPRLRPRKKEDKKAAAIIEQIAEKIAKTPEIETNKDIELALRIKLEVEHITYKKLYLQWAKQQIKAEEKRIKRKKRRREDNMIVVLMLQ